MMRWSVLLLVLLAGCGSKGGGDGFETPDKQGDAYVIHLTAERTFDPDKATVPTGAQVAFQFGLPDCDVRSDTPGGPDSREGVGTGIHVEGDRYTWQAPASPGEFDVHCNRHYDAGMRGVIKVG